MTVDVQREVFHHAKAIGIKGTAFAVLIVLADAASPDGVCWTPIVPSSGRKADDPRCITHRANCSKRSAIRALDELSRAGAIEIRKAQRGRARINVYRVILGSIAEVEVEYERLPFDLDRPFGRGDNLAPSQAESETGYEVPTTTSTRCQPRHRRGANHDIDEVPTAPQRARVSDGFAVEPPVEPQGEPSVEPPAAEQERDLPVLSYEDDDKDSAAAGAGPASLDEVVGFIGRLASADLGTVRQIEPYARALPRERFQRAAAKLLERRQRGSVENDAGLFHHLLRVEFKEHVKDEAVERAAQLRPVEALTRIERMKRDEPRRFLRLMLRPPVDHGLPPIGDDYIERFLEDNVHDEAERDELREFARSLRADVDAEAAA